MTVDDIISLLELPRSARVDQRIAKKMLIDNAPVTATDKRKINEGIEELIWVAALKPHTIGVPIYRDEIREYLEIAVLSLILRPAAKAARLVELVHRAIPYPVLLISAQEDTLNVSVAHKRQAQNEPGKVVLDESAVEGSLPRGNASEVALPPLSLARQPRANLFALYQGWLEWVETLQAAVITGDCRLPTDATSAAARRVALVEFNRLTREIGKLRAQAEREVQLARRVELNLEIKRLETALAAAREQL